MPLLNTARKVSIARMIASALLTVGVRPLQHKRLHGITFELDIREGIDLSLFLFGSFQRHVTKFITTVVPPDGIVIDVGANIGAVTIPVAAHLESGHVYAIEPTDYALTKLRKNLELNPGLADRVSVIQTFIADKSAETSEMVAYSSWPVTPSSADNQHPIHKGIAMEAPCGQITIDEFIHQQNLQTVSLMKIDTDGHEFSVITGAAECMATFRPYIIFEASEYLMRPPRPTFEDFMEMMVNRSYTICEGPPLAPMTPETFRRKCPDGGSLDLIAVPNEYVR
jgi:FkbM family methyltransferase